MRVDVDVDKNLKEKFVGAMRKGLDEGLQETGETLLENGQEVAEDAAAAQMWNKEVKRGFETEESDFQRSTSWHGKIFNPVQHADVVDRGIAPQGEIELSAPPPIQALMPWVVDNLDPADYGGGDGSPDFTPGDGGDGGDQPSGITEDDFTVSNFRSTTDLGIPEEQFFSKYPRAATLGNGNNVIWKSHDALDTGPMVKNEVVWSLAQEDADKDLGPKSRLHDEVIDGEERSGTMQEYVEGASDMFENVYLGRTEREGQITREQFIRENKEWLSTIAPLDYITGNSDRHSGNIVFDEDDNPRAIDNGGSSFQDDLMRASLTSVTEFSDYGDAKNPSDLQQANFELLEKVEENLDDLADNLEYRKQIIERVAQVHGEDSDFYDRIVNVIGEDITPWHFMVEDENGDPLYKRHIEGLRDKHITLYDARNEDPSYDDGSHTKTNLDEIDEMMGDLMGGDFDI